ncbi:MAG: phosphatase PAP2 family protein [Oligoflexia bacterium]|nr:phosphatase PAP2 family protein [Oligoflexia bacterium]
MWKKIYYIHCLLYCFSVILLSSWCSTYPVIAEEVSQEYSSPSWYNVSPPGIRNLSLFLGILGTVFTVSKPEHPRPFAKAPDFDKNADRMEWSKWAYDLGDHTPTIVTVGQYLYYFIWPEKYRFERAVVFTEALLIMQGTVAFTKYTIGRQRPDGSNNVSFPSGHTAHTFTWASYLATDIIRRNSGAARWIYSAIPYSVAAFVGGSRISGSKHYLSDVTIGALIGTFIGYTLYDFHFNDKGEYRFTEKNKIHLSINVLPSKDLYAMSLGSSF